MTYEYLCVFVEMYFSETDITQIMNRDKIINLAKNKSVNRLMLTESGGGLLLFFWGTL